MSPGAAETTKTTTGRRLPRRPRRATGRKKRIRLLPRTRMRIRIRTRRTRRTRTMAAAAAP